MESGGTLRGRAQAGLWREGRGLHACAGWRGRAVVALTRARPDRAAVSPKRKGLTPEGARHGFIGLDARKPGPGIAGVSMPLVLDVRL